ncbi:hypothetical protein CYMTET_9790 [Cymbomonas tetramitiformis]|uniref:Uncharacterized protein n=1 Tax=Cymbomonas tetramitiformis TaxID=36881 RepID=A0AAE0GQD1_9CHLO|nr:hypothetical protein CYMTET_9790 [Cymbomonas tetramitiformis]
MEMEAVKEEVMETRCCPVAMGGDGGGGIGGGGGEEVAGTVVVERVREVAVREVAGREVAGREGSACPLALVQGYRIIPTIYIDAAIRRVSEELKKGRGVVMEMEAVKEEVMETRCCPVAMGGDGGGGIGGGGGEGGGGEGGGGEGGGGEGGEGGGEGGSMCPGGNGGGGYGGGGGFGLGGGGDKGGGGDGGGDGGESPVLESHIELADHAWLKLFDELVASMEIDSKLSAAPVSVTSKQFSLGLALGLALWFSLRLALGLTLRL